MATHIFQKERDWGSMINAHPIRPSGMKSEFGRISPESQGKWAKDLLIVQQCLTFGFSALKGRSKTRPVSPVRGQTISKGIYPECGSEWIDQTDLRTDFLELDAHALRLLVILAKTRMNPIDFPAPNATALTKKPECPAPTVVDACFLFML
jgi:hypothetical protein